MAELHLDHIPEELYAQLSRLAEARRQSINATVISVLEAAVSVQTERQDPRHVLAAIRSHRFTPPPGLDSLDLLREDRRR